MKRVLLAFALLLTVNSFSQTKPDTIQQVKESLDWFHLDFNEAEIDSMLDGMRENKELYTAMHKYFPVNSLLYPFAFDPLPGLKVSTKKDKIG